MKNGELITHPVEAEAEGGEAGRWGGGKAGQVRQLQITLPTVPELAHGILNSSWSHDIILYHSLQPPLPSAFFFLLLSFTGLAIECLQFHLFSPSTLSLRGR